MGGGEELKITVIGVLIVVAGVLLLGLVIAAGQSQSGTGKTDERPINPS